MVPGRSVTSPFSGTISHSSTNFDASVWTPRAFHQPFPERLRYSQPFGTPFFSCDVAVGALVALINYFPNLNRLDLRHSRKIDDKLIPPLSRPLLGQLYIAQTYEDLGLLDQLSELGLVFDEILFNSGLRVHTRTLRRIVDGVGVNVERLRLLDPLSRDGMQTPSQAEPTPKLTESNTMFLQTVRKTNQQYSPVAESSRN